MASTSETGHAKNVANFKKMTEGCESMGTTYNPSNAALSLAALKAGCTSGENALKAVSESFPFYTNAVGERQHVFIPLEPLVMRVQSSLESCGAIPQVVETGRTFARKLLGRRAKAKLTEEEKLAKEAETGKAVVEHSSSQQSFDSKIDYFERMTDLLKTVSEYAPNETDLQVASLSAYLESLKTLNTAVVKAELALNKARENRDLVLYANTTGLVDISTAVKKYIKSATSASSPNYRTISALQFKSYKK